MLQILSVVHRLKMVANIAILFKNSSVKEIQ